MEKLLLSATRKIWCLSLMSKLRRCKQMSNSSLKWMRSVGTSLEISSFWPVARELSMCWGKSRVESSNKSVAVMSLSSCLFAVIPISSMFTKLMLTQLISFALSLIPLGSTLLWEEQMPWSAYGILMSWSVCALFPGTANLHHRINLYSGFTITKWHLVVQLL